MEIVIEQKNGKKSEEQKFGEPKKATNMGLDRESISL